MRCRGISGLTHNDFWQDFEQNAASPTCRTCSWDEHGNLKPIHDLTDAEAASIAIEVRKQILKSGHGMIEAMHTLRSGTGRGALVLPGPFKRASDVAVFN